MAALPVHTRTQSHKPKKRTDMKYALVTGASSGIGEEYARLLAEGGCNVIVASNRDGENRRVAEQLRHDCGVEAEPLYADLTEADAADKIYAWCRQRQIEVDILVSNAGILHFGLLAHTDTATIDRITALHCTTPAKLCRLFAADMCRRGGGRILLMSSITAWTPYPTMSLYGATKAFLRNFGTSLRLELRGSGVSVTTVFPGAVDTPLYDLSERHRRILRSTGLMLSARETARRGLRAMIRGRARCIPGMAAKIEAFLCRLLPACAIIPVMRIPAVRRLLERL